MFEKKRFNLNKRLKKIQSRRRRRRLRSSLYFFLTFILRLAFVVLTLVVNTKTIRCCYRKGILMLKISLLSHDDRRKISSGFINGGRFTIRPVPYTVCT